MKPISKLCFLWLLLQLGLFCTVQAQQNVTMYMIHENPQVNTLNPAFQNSCKLFIGIPILTSIHFNAGIDAFSYRDLFKNNEGSNVITPSTINPARVSSLNGELYTEWVNIGFWQKKTYITVSISERVDASFFMHRDLLNFIIGGNTAYEGEKANFSATGAFIDYRREYALGFSKKINSETTFGIKGKILFGKINVSTQKSNSKLFTDATSFNLTAQSEIKANMSAPVTLSLNQNGLVNDIAFTGSFPEVFLNRKNIGVAFDIGFIHTLNEYVTISGSILDLGFIYYTSTPNNYSTQGTYVNNGQLSNNTAPGNFIDEIFNGISGDFTGSLQNKPYQVFLTPRVYLNYEYKYSPRINFNAIGTAKVYRYKVLPAIGIGSTFQIFKHFNIAASWAYIDRSIKNIGVGLVAGRTPVQFYAFTDNILGFTNPLSARNFNLRFGINLIFGCTQKTDTNKPGCTWIKEAEKDRERYRRLKN